MKERISILVDVLPKYGEILLGLGSILLENPQELLENYEAREKIKKFLVEETAHVRNINGLCMSQEFQSIMYDYIGKFIHMAIMKNNISKDKIVNIYLYDFFCKALWPIFVNRYIDNIVHGLDMITVSVNVKKNVYVTIYGENTLDTLFSEIKEFLLCNYIIISEAVTKPNGDLQLKLILPIPPHHSYDA